MRYRVIEESKKNLHGWYAGKRECTSERLLVNPYNGCANACVFCYALAYPGCFSDFRKNGTITVWKDYDGRVARQLDGIKVASCGYLSPVTDPFQEPEHEFKVSEKIIREFVSRNAPVEFITKSEVPEDVLDIMKTQKHSFGQVSIITLDEKKRKKLVPNGARVNILLDNVRRISEKLAIAVARIDPVIPYVTDAPVELDEIARESVKAGARHIIVSVMDVPIRIKNHIFGKFRELFGNPVADKMKKVYTERMGGYMHADINYRKAVFARLKNTCDGLNVTFSLCMEYEKKNGACAGLNRLFSNSYNCEGIDVPLYVKKDGSGRFEPLDGCKGNCLGCGDGVCGIDGLMKEKLEDSKKDFLISDYRRWSKVV